MKKISAALCALLAAITLLSFAGCTVPAEKIEFGKEFYAVREGDTVSPDVTVTPSMSYTLSTEFAAVAVIENGLIKGVKRGVTVLHAEAGGLRASVTIEVLASDGTSSQPGDGKCQVLYVVDEKAQNYYQNYLRAGEKTPDLTLEKNGFDFQGWYTDKTYTTRFDFDTPITGDVKIWGKYDIVQGVKTPFVYSKPVEGTLYVMGLLYKDVPYTDIEIPQEAEVNGISYPVVGFVDNALQKITSLQKIAMPYIRNIGHNVLAECINLKTVTANEALEYVGRGVLSGTKWLNAEKLRNYNGKYHGAQLGNCYFYGVDQQPAVYLWDNVAICPKVTLFAADALKDGTKIYVPQSLLEYYKNHKNLMNFKNLIFTF